MTGCFCGQSNERAPCFFKFYFGCPRGAVQCPKNINREEVRNNITTVWRGNQSAKIVEVSNLANQKGRQSKTQLKQ